MENIESNPVKKTASSHEFKPLDQAAVQTTIDLLEAILLDRRSLASVSPEKRKLLMMAAGRVSRPEKLEVMKITKRHRRARKYKERMKDRQATASTAIREARLNEVYTPPVTALLPGEVAKERPKLNNPRACYVCKREYSYVHFFYDSMCTPCGDLNFSKRTQLASLEGRVAVITGARLKIGYQSAILMLRAGARVIVTTRFPQDAAARYAREADYAVWGHRLQIHGLDLRHAPSVELFTQHLNDTCDRLDILINNAAQTVRRPPGFYRHLLAFEATPHGQLPAAVQPLLTAYESWKSPSQLSGAREVNTELEKDAWVTELALKGAAIGLQAPSLLSQLPYKTEDEVEAPELFPEGKTDADLQQVDLRRMNSWRMKLADVPTSEMIEVQLINAVAPFILCARLKPLMNRHRTNEKHIVNVSAMEGKFTRYTKTDRHPHTNMAKASLNMMTLTSAPDYAKDGIYMNAVDTGWVTDEDPAQLSQAKQEEHDFQPPLDIVDGAARVCDPFFSGLLTGKHVWGKFLKDYTETSW